uniref:Uncharacterized protein n=1 Tax=Sus scrofa TaxID=9823 RepID=A0A8D1A078_PIG
WRQWIWSLSSPNPPGLLRWAEALPRCSSGLRPCQISMFLSLKCLNTRSSHLRAHGRKMVPKILSLLVKDGAPKAFII